MSPGTILDLRQIAKSLIDRPIGKQKPTSHCLQGLRGQSIASASRDDRLNFAPQQSTASLSANLLSEQGAEFSEHDIQPIDVRGIRQHLF
jgi:hypothetical protein